MRITTKISHYHKGILALLLAPFLWLQMYFYALEAWLFQFMYEQFFNTKDDAHYSQTTHLLAFVCFSAFCLLAYHKSLDDYISLILYGLWLINYLSVRFKTGLYVHKAAWVRLEKKPDCWQWHLIAKNQHQLSQNLTAQTIETVLIAAATYGDKSFRNQVLQIWHVYIQTKDQQQWVVYQEEKIERALSKAVALANQLNTQVKIAESYGTGRLPDMEIEPPNLVIQAWEQHFLGTATLLYKNFSTVSLWRWLKVLFTHIKDFLFIGALSGFMSQYGGLLLVLWGEQLGLQRPEVIYLDGFEPNFNLTEVLFFVTTLITLLLAIYQQHCKHCLLISHDSLQYSVSGKQKGTLYFTRKPDIIVLKGFDKTAVIFVNEENKVLEINGLEEYEYDQLYTLWLAMPMG